MTEDGRGNPEISEDSKCVILDDEFYLCSAMTKWLNGSTVNQPKSNKISRLINLETGYERYVGIVAHIPGSPGIYINFCPFCGSKRVLNFKDDELVKAGEG